VTNVIGSSPIPTILPLMAWLYDLGSAFLGFVVAHPLLVLGFAVAVAVVLGLVARRLGVVDLARRRPRAAMAILIPMLAVGLPVGWYLTSPLVLSASIDEAPPIVAASTVGPPATASPKPAPSISIAASRSGEPARTAVAPTPAPTAITQPTPRSGAFHGSDDFHFGRGTARLIEVAPGSFVVRLEDFAVRNGPDLFVYLSPSADGYATGAIELGRLKADTGNQNYVVPAGALGDPTDAASVVIWCKQFSHLFATAPLAP
jgi:hypothetical protein